MNIIETKNLTKSYTDFTAVSGINLHIPKGAVYGFLGPNPPAAHLRLTRRSIPITGYRF